MKKYEVLKKYYGYEYLKKEQEEIIDKVLSKKNTIGLLPTGFGKSLTFQIPALIFEGLTIVITPLISLMYDQVESLKKKNICARYINSTQTKEEQDKIYYELISNKVKLLYVSAERLESNYFLSQIKKIKIDFLVIDEAHTLLWSEDFRISLGHIPNFIKYLGYHPTILALTATATNKTLEKIINLVKLNNPKIIECSCDRENIYYRIIRTNQKDEELLNILVSHKGQRGIIYTLTIKTAKKLYIKLKDLGFSVGIYHGSLSKEEKNNMQALYSKRLIDFIVCTSSFGMGVDYPDVRFVVEYDIPQSVEDFVQQTGRGSRDGKYAEGIVLFSLDDIKTANYFIENIRNNEKTNKELDLIKKDRFKKLDSMIELCLTRKCIHQYICNYFNQSHNGRCNMCYNCKKK